MAPKKTVQTWAAEYDRQLRADDKRFNRYVHIVHQDGSTMFFTYAFLVSVNHWLVAFTEHTGFHLFHKDDLEFYSQFETRVSVEKIDAQNII